MTKNTKSNKPSSNGKPSTTPRAQQQPPSITSLEKFTRAQYGELLTKTTALVTSKWPRDLGRFKRQLELWGESDYACTFLTEFFTKWHNAEVVPDNVFDHFMPENALTLDPMDTSNDPIIFQQGSRVLINKVMINLAELSPEHRRMFWYQPVVDVMMFAALQPLVKYITNYNPLHATVGIGLLMPVMTPPQTSQPS